ncbi:MAG TPA: GNAT family N-acetyltransferase [Candidatus Tumulicola sp.]|jgi:GNAT superfamily N-acetyltransferase
MAKQPDIRQATFDDCQALAPIFDQYRKFFTGKSDSAGSHAFLSDRLRRQESVVFAAFEGESALGFAQLYPMFSSWYVSRQWFLSDLFVVPDSRRAGIARRLLDACAAFARETKARSILVEMPFSEPHLIQLYEAVGYGPDKDFALYRLKLTGP